MALTADYLLTQVKSRCQLPAANGKLTDAEILSLADEELLTTCLPVLRRAREEYGVKETDVTIVSGTKDYRVPARAQSGTLRDVVLLDSNSNAYDMVRVPLEQVDEFSTSSLNNWPGGAAFALMGSTIRIVPTPTQSGWTMRLRYYHRPSLLTESDSARVTILSFVGASTTYAADTQNNHSTNDVIDFVQASGQLDTLATDYTFTDLGGGSFQVDANVPDAAIGDYVVDAGYTPVVPLPQEMHPVLLRATCSAVLEAIGDREGFRLMEAKTQQAIESVETLVNDRTEGSPVRIVNWNSPMRYGRGRGWG